MVCSILMHQFLSLSPSPEGGRARRSYFHIQIFTKFSFNCISIHFYCPRAWFCSGRQFQGLRPDYVNHDFLTGYGRRPAAASDVGWLAKSRMWTASWHVKNLKSARFTPALHFRRPFLFRTVLVLDPCVHSSIYNSHSECSSFLSFLNLINPIFRSHSTRTLLRPAPTQKMAHKRLITGSSSRVET